MENLQVNQMEQVRPAIEKPKKEWTRTTFKDHNGNYWCYRKKEKHKEFDREIERGYYCANPSCKNELFFKWEEDSYYRDNQPFKFHKVLVKVLEKKEDDWRTGRKTHTYYAFCCKCIKEDENDGTVKKNKFTKKLMGFEVDKCYCATFIEEKKRETNVSINNYKEMIADCDWLLNELETIKKNNNLNNRDFNKGFKCRRIDDFKEQLEKRREDAIESKTKEHKYLATYNEWENKRNQQLET